MPTDPSWSSATAAVVVVVVVVVVMTVVVVVVVSGSGLESCDRQSTEVRYDTLVTVWSKDLF